MISDKKNTEDDFMCYLAERVSPAQLSKLYRCYSEIETFCLKIKVLQGCCKNTLLYIIKSIIP